MSFFDKGILWFVMLSFSVLIISVGMLLSADTSTDNALKEATKQSMYAGVEKGCLRVDENLVLNEEVVKTTFLSRYQELTDYEEGTTDLYIHNLNEYAPMLATESYQTVTTPFMRFINGLTHSTNTDQNSVRSFEVAVFEATSLVKPSTAENRLDVGSSNEVDNFQCK